MNAILREESDSALRAEGRITRGPKKKNATNCMQLSVAFDTESPRFFFGVGVLLDEDHLLACHQRTRDEPIEIRSG